MAARSSRGVQVYMSTAAAGTGTPLTPTAITAASPAVVTVASTAGMAASNVVVIPASATGMASLDGRSWTVGEVINGTTFELLGSDTAGEVYAAGASPQIMHYDGGDMVLLCLASLTRNAGTASTTSVGTYCDPTATLANPVIEAGSYDFTGYIDITDTGFRELTEAYEDGNVRHFEVILPENGTLVFDGTVSVFDYDVPIDGALGYTGTITLAGRPRHLFD